MKKKIETVYLHIGFSKTGTTSLQKALSNSRNKLRKNGILYPNAGIHTHNFMARELTNLPNFQPRQTSHPLSLGMCETANLPNLQWKNHRRLEFRRKMEKDIEAFSGGVLIVSAEMFDRLLCDRLGREGCRKVIEYLSQYCDKIKICTYVRNPFDFTVSLIKQRVQVGIQGTYPESRVIERLESLEGIDTVPLNRERLSVWIGEVGLENMLTIPYDRERLIGGSTVTDFLARTGIDGALVEIPPEESNPSLTMTGMFVKNEMNKRAGSKGLKLGKADYLRSLPGPRFLPSKRFAEAMRERCLEDLAWLSATFGIDLANDSGGHRGPWKDYFTDEMKAVLKDMLDRGCKFRLAREEQIFREVAAGILSGRIFAS